LFAQKINDKYNFCTVYILLMTNFLFVTNIIIIVTEIKKLSQQGILKKLNIYYK